MNIKLHTDNTMKTKSPILRYTLIAASLATLTLGTVTTHAEGRNARLGHSRAAGLGYPAPSGLLLPAVQKVVGEHGEDLIALRDEFGHDLGFTLFLEFFAFDTNFKSGMDAAELIRYYEELEFTIISGLMDYTDREWLQFLDEPELRLVFREETNAVIDQIILELFTLDIGTVENFRGGVRVGHFMEGGEGFDFAIDPNSQSARLVRHFFSLIGLDLDGGEGNDLVIDSDLVREVLLGGRGNDVLEVPDRSLAVELLGSVLGQGDGQLSPIGNRGDEVQGLLIGGDGADVFESPSGGGARKILELLIGGDGVDVVAFLFGEDRNQVLGVVLGQDGDDLLFAIGDRAQEVLEVLRGGAGNDTITGPGSSGGPHIEGRAPRRR